ncbi:syndetin-like isoform X2 [Ruditapes philippinarum]|uniref:syndetin-like isoform X2 n=1 Tax=Ruditapes philippinarum TaxID=129788 RepID=UPI00295BE306|nr:syndetin-like isoform X2 [Ruditapes philippinarum]
MSLTSKLKSFIKKQVTTNEDSHPSPIEENISHELFNGEPAVAKFKHEQYRSNPQEDQETIDKIDKEYFEDVDPSLYELEKLPEVLNLEQVDDDRTRLRRQLQAVSKKVSEVVLQNHLAYAAELQRVMELQKTLQLASIICKNGRGQLAEASTTFTRTSLHLLANVRKRQQLHALLKSLRTIKTLQRTDMRLREMMEEEDYYGAIQLCLECQKAAITLKHYKCISELSSKLQDTLELIEEHLDIALSKTCSLFDVAHYEKVQMAYTLLGKRQTAVDQLHLHFTSAIQNAAFQIVLGYVELCSPSSDRQFNRLQYSDLCKHVTIESFTPCLRDLCKSLWGVMRSYYNTIRWHEEHDNLDTVQIDEDSSDTDSMNTVYIKQKLEHGLGRIWQDIQQKVRTYILGIDLSAFKLEEFIQFLDTVNRMIDIGEDFCDSKSEHLQDSLKQQSLNYFKNHHRAKMDELRMFLENEGWELCPVKSSFHIQHLVEFKFMKQTSPKKISANKNSNNKLADQSDSPIKRCKYFEEYSGNSSPFDIQTDTDYQEDVFAGVGDDNSGEEHSDSDSDVPDELKQDYIDELTGETHSRPGRRRYSRSRSYQKHVSIVTNTSLNVFRVIGKYIQMMRLLKPIAFDVMTCMAQLFDFYMYSVFIFFGTELSSMDERQINNRLRSTLQRIHDSLIDDVHEVDNMEDPQHTEHREKIAAPHLSPIVDLNNPQKRFGLPERIVAAESLVFLGEQMEFLQPHLEAIIPQNKKAFLQQFYSQTVNMAAELRKPVYWTVSTNVINYDIILQHMAAVKWDIKEIMSQHNSYVDVLIQQFSDFNSYMSELCRHMPVPRATYDQVWDQILRLSARTFVEGYGNTKKCSIEGRALMQLDFQQYLKNVEKLIDLRPIPDREYVEGYIKAYYFPENQLEAWLPEHREYSIKQLLVLVNAVDHLNRKARQRLVNMVEDMDKNSRR